MMFVLLDSPAGTPYARRVYRHAFAKLMLLAVFAWLSDANAQVSEAPPDTEPPSNPFALPPLPPDAPKPASDLRNLGGTWLHLQVPVRWLKTDKGENLPYRPAAQAVVDHRRARDAEGKPVANQSALCRPPGILWDFELNFPFRILQETDKVVFVFEEFHSIWRIFIEQPPPSKNVPLSYGGRSSGHWEGNTLVVRTVGLRDDTWLDIAGSPHSAEAVYEHRIRRIGRGDVLEVSLTVTDPKMYKQAWTVTRLMDWRPDRAMLAEFDCEESTGSEAEAGRFRVYSDDAVSTESK